MAMNKPFEILPHTADIVVRAYGPTQAELFKNALMGMFACMEPKFSNLNMTSQRTITVHAPDREALIIAFLSEALYTSAIYYEAYTDSLIHECTATDCSATLIGSPIHGYEGPEIKAVTYHDVNITTTATHWQATITFDI
jgi:SHS2 domain-containing protein